RAPPTPPPARAPAPSAGATRRRRRRTARTAAAAPPARAGASRPRAGRPPARSARPPDRPPARVLRRAPRRPLPARAAPGPPAARTPVRAPRRAGTTRRPVSRHDARPPRRHRDQRRRPPAAPVARPCEKIHPDRWRRPLRVLLPAGPAGLDPGFGGRSARLATAGGWLGSQPSGVVAGPFSSRVPRNPKNGTASWRRRGRIRAGPATCPGKPARTTGAARRSAGSRSGSAARTWLGPAAVPRGTRNPHDHRRVGHVPERVPAYDVSREDLMRTPAAVDVEVVEEAPFRLRVPARGDMRVDGVIFTSRDLLPDPAE